MVLNAHLNRHGNLFGGQMMAWMDIAAAIHCGEVMQMNCVTVKADEIVFKTPVKLGDILTFEVQEIKRGTTSMTVYVHVTKTNLEERDIEVASSHFTFVAIDENGKASSAWNDQAR